MNEQERAHSLVMRFPEKVIVEYACPHLTAKKHRHHYDYSLPFNVHLLCPKCHKERHIKLPDEKYPTKVRAFMIGRNITRKEMADVLGLGPQTITKRIRAGKWFIKEIEKIAAAYNINPKELI